MIRNPRYVIAVHDLDRSARYYQDVLGFEALHQAVIAKGGKVGKSLRDEPWGMREFGIRRVDGHRIMFGQRIRATG